jgi:uncharacterized protein involved in exopolysaccharide biosynthesis
MNVDVLNLIKRIAKGILRRRKRLVVLVFVGTLLVMLPVVYTLSKEPQRFRASATVLLEARPTQVPLFQELSPFRPLPVQLALLKSRGLAEGVLDSLPKTAMDDLTRSPYHVDYASMIRNAYMRMRGFEPEVESPRQRALTELQKARVKFESRGDGILDISAEASRPQVAVDIVNTYIEVLLSRTRSFNIDDARTSREFLEQQLADVKKNLKGSEDSLRAFTTAHGGVKVPERSKATTEQLSQAEQSLAEIETNRRML